MILAPKAKCYLRVVFTPTASGSRSATLLLTGTVTGLPQTVALSGTGGTPNITLSATSLTFDTSWPGKSLPVKYAKLTNSGTGTATLSGASVRGTEAGDFTLSDPATLPAGKPGCTSGMTLAPKAKCYFGINFNPTASGAQSATLVISDDAADSPQSLALSGTGGTPKSTLSAASLAFGRIELGSSSTGRHLTISNSGTWPLTVAGVSLEGTNPGDFAVSDYSGACTTGMTLNVGAKCVLALQFNPKSAGARSASLVITDDTAASPKTVLLSGTGK
jgi:hypothetical protein